MNKRLLFLELNEVNFDLVQAYVARGKLPAFAQLIARHGLSRTTSESKYEELEPWIQWVTAHTGRTLAEHGVYRLGDIVEHDIPQIWEQLESAGLRVGAISPMNAKHRVRNAAFFVPDPWTRTGVSAGPVLRNLYGALSQAVNENATATLNASSLAALAVGAATYAQPRNYLKYLQLAAGSLRQSWRRAVFLDLLLADVFVAEVRKRRPDFATLFLNGAAHLQHHYLFCAEPYTGPHRNPEWYIPRGIDPIHEIYALYDRVVGQVQKSFPDVRLMVATGLHQVPHTDATYYWRLKDHARFLRLIGIDSARVEPRMSRDFLVSCSSPEAAVAVEQRLKSAVHEDGAPLFEIDNRGTTLFVMLTYPKEIRRGSAFSVGGQRFEDLLGHVAFVALKNGEHNGIGYFLDTGAPEGSTAREFPLKQIPTRIMEALQCAAVPPVG